jgi:aspartyl-tRNA(Asn)/glutamyl-tRNA(Gln) amidotransferase subunit A
VQLSPLQDWHDCGYLIALVERAAAYEEWARTRLADFGQRTRNRLMLGAFASGVDYLQAVRRRRELRAELQMAMTGLDAVLTAVLPAEAPKIDDVPTWDVFQQPSFVMPFNIAGYPAVSVCSGFGANRLPVAIQLVGKPFQETIVLRIADAFEKATPFRDRHPLAA